MTAKLSTEELADILSNEAAPAMVERESLNDATRECLQLAILDAAAELSRLSAQVREAEALKAWQPIATAVWPTSGFTFDDPEVEWIVLTNRGRVYAATPHSNGWVYSKNYRHTTRLGAMPARKDAIKPTTGNFAADEEWVTHWQPLPPPANLIPDVAREGGTR